MPKSNSITNTRATARSTAWLLGALTLGIAAVVLWLVLRTIQSERLASREQWREAAQLRLQSAVTRMRESWQQREATVIQLSDLPPAEFFTYMVRNHLADTAVCGAGLKAYPSLESAAGAVDEQAVKELTTTGELINKGDHDGALALANGFFKEHRSGTTSEGRNIAAAADLMMLNTLATQGKAIPEWLSERLVEQLKTYGADPLPSAQRRYLMERLATLMQRHPTDLFPTYHAEVLAQDFLSKGDAPDFVVARVRDAVLLIAPDILARTSKDEAVRLVWSGDLSLTTDELTAEISPALRDWRAVLSLKQHATVINAGSTFGLALGGGIATLGLALLTGLTWRNVQQQLKRAQLQEELTATVSHELRTPLSSMRVLVESLLEEDSPDAAKTREYLELIARENTRLSRMIENFLRLARLERDKKSDDEHRRLDALEREYAYLTKVENPDLQSVCKNILNRIDIVRKGLRATLEEHKQAQAIFDQGKQDFPKLTDDSIFCYQESELKRPCVGEGMPIQFTALDGSQVDSAALKGKVVVVYSWESSQRESLEALPGLKAMYQKFHDKGLEVLGIPWDKDEAALRDFIKKENIPWPQAFDGKGRKNAVAVKYGLNTVLLHYIIGRDGKVADYEVSDSSKLEAKVAELLK